MLIRKAYFSSLKYSVANDMIVVLLSQIYKTFDGIKTEVLNIKCKGVREMLPPGGMPTAEAWTKQHHSFSSDWFHHVQPLPYCNPQHSNAYRQTIALSSFC